MGRTDNGILEGAPAQPPGDLPRDSPDDGADDGADEEENGQGVDDSNMATPASTGATPKVSSIEVAEPESGRLYTMWPDTTGQFTPLCGALLPSGYQLDTTYPGRAWVCPVRTCRKACVKRQDLGFHFERAHYASLLNDNCDGTFSILEVYRKRVMVKGGRLLVKGPCLVVSKNPIGPHAPLPPIRLPDYVDNFRDHHARQVLNPTPVPLPSVPTAPSAPTAPIAPTAPRATRAAAHSGDTDALWRYIRPRLDHTRYVPSKYYIRQMLSLPRQRDLQLREQAIFIEKKDRDVAAMIIQVTGELNDKGCNRCREGKGPFDECVVIAPNILHLEELGSSAQPAAF